VVRETYHGCSTLFRQRRQRRPQLQNAQLPEGFQVLVVDDAATCGHPQDVSGSQQTFVTVACFALDRERHDFETSMRMRATGTLSRWKIDAIVRKHDEGIVLGKLPRVDHVNRRVTLADETWARRRKRDDACEAACARD
jgi:hypothetical protein